VGLPASSIILRSGPAGLRAALADGPDVWEVVGALHAIHAEDPELDGNSLLAEMSSVTGLSVAQVATALRYYAAHPVEIDERIALNVAIADREALIEHELHGR
jgi:hypothetical protein